MAVKIIPFFGPLDRRIVHFVDNHDKLFDAGSLCKHGMFPGLPSSLEASLELTLSGRDDKDTNIGLGGTTDHARDKGLVSWSIENGVSTLVGFKIRATILGRFPLREWLDECAQ